MKVTVKLIGTKLEVALDVKGLATVKVDTDIKTGAKKVIDATPTLIDDGLYSSFIEPQLARLEAEGKEIVILEKDL